MVFMMLYSAIYHKYSEFTTSIIIVIVVILYVIILPVWGQISTLGCNKYITIGCLSLFN